MEKVQRKENNTLLKNQINSSIHGETSQLLSSTSLLQKKEKNQENIFGRGVVQAKENKTGLPDNLKNGIESLSGYSMNDVKVHYNSAQPAQLNAHAFAQGSEIHVASGQEKHLPHEAWHVVQQKQGRVQPTQQMKGKTNINDDVSLEREADVMGEQALQINNISSPVVQKIVNSNSLMIQKFEADEHKKLGGFDGILDLERHIHTKKGKIWLKKLGYTDNQIRVLKEKIKKDSAFMKKNLKSNKAVLEYGDATLMMGDLFGSFNSLVNASQDTVDAMKDAKTTSDYQKASNGNYLKLAKKNTSHFGREAKSTWERLHLEAIKDAYRADDKQFDLAMIKENAAAHFMTDSFSSGHLFDKNILLTHIYMYLSNSKDTIMPTGLGSVANILKLLKQEEYSQLLVKIIHDELNTSGFNIENERGWSWKAYGDNQLNASAEHQNTIALVVVESRSQIMNARKRKIMSEEIERIRQLLPNEKTILNAEKKAISLIPKAIKKLPSLLPTFGKDTRGVIGDDIPYIKYIPVLGKLAPFILTGVIRGGLKTGKESDSADSLKLNFVINDNLYLQYEHRYDNNHKKDSIKSENSLSLGFDF